MSGPTKSASGRSRTNVAKAELISLLVPALRTWICSPMARAADCTSRNVGSLLAAFAGLTSTATRVVAGTSSCRSSNRFAINSALKILIPVALPPGRARLATRPTLTGSSVATKTTGIVFVAALTASAEVIPPVAAITATCRRTKSAASAGNNCRWRRRGQDDLAGGRYAKITRLSVVVSSLVAYPRQPETSPWHHDPCGVEPPLGYSVEDQEPTGEKFEQQRSLKSPEQGGTPTSGVAPPPNRLHGGGAFKRRL